MPHDGAEMPNSALMSDLLDLTAAALPQVEAVLADATSKLRAKVDASFEEVVSGRERIATEASSSPDVDRVWRVQSGDRIDRIAQESYGHVAYWRQIARANRLVNPRALVAGSVLSLPRLERS